MKQVFVCEKPSQARALAEALSEKFANREGYYEGHDGKIFTYAFGHLVTCEMDQSKLGWRVDLNTLPFFMPNIPLAIIDDAGVKKQYKVIVSLMKAADIIYIATDAGREGEHIFRKIYQLSGVDKPLKRLWLQDMTKDGIVKSFHGAKEGSAYEALAIAGRLREESDMLIGFNSTILLSKLSGSGKPLSLGRVQTPTLAMIVRRDDLIDNFAKQQFYTIVADQFELTLDEKLTKQQAEAIKASLKYQRSDIRFVRKNIEEKPPKLFDLTQLQVHMNKLNGWSAETTLKMTQSLYEKKLVTYPRTSSQYLANDSELPALLQSHAGNHWVQQIQANGYKIEKTFVNPSKVTDHEAIIITKEKPRNLNANENILYNAILTRFLCAFFPPCVKGKTTATFTDSEYLFTANETIIKVLGWRELTGESVGKSEIAQIKIADVGDYKILEKETKPPQRYTEATLLQDMKNAGKFLEEADEKKLLKQVEGIGTPATRASIIELLMKRTFIERKGKSVIATELGKTIINMMPEQFSLYSPKLTAEFETMLLQVEKKQLEDKVFYAHLETLIQQISVEIRSNVKEVNEAGPSSSKEIVAICPVCNKPIYENTKAYGCSGYRNGCKITLWKNGLTKLGKKNITAKEAKQLLEGKAIKVKLKSKAGNPYEKDVKFNPENNWVVFAD